MNFTLIAVNKLPIKSTLLHFLLLICIFDLGAYFLFQFVRCSGYKVNDGGEIPPLKKKKTFNDRWSEALVGVDFSCVKGYV